MVKRNIEDLELDSFMMYLDGFIKIAVKRDIDIIGIISAHSDENKIKEYLNNIILTANERKIDVYDYL
jgi:hypothetical protein